MNIISYSLFGDNKKYTINALVNAELCAKYYAGWMCYIYYDNTVPSVILYELKKHSNVVLIPSTGTGHSRRMWRFMAYDLSDVFISRDIDSHITEREVSAVNEWLNSDKNLHIMRDYKGQSRKILAGMFGIKKCKKLQSLKNLVLPFLAKQTSVNTDEDFLEKVVYNLFKNDMVVHDENNHHNDSTHTWKVPIMEELFIGCPVNNNTGVTRINNNLTKKYYDLY